MRKILNKQQNYIPKGTRKEEETKPKVHRSKEKIKTRAQKNEIDTNRKISMILSQYFENIEYIKVQPDSSREKKEYSSK